MEHVPVLCRGGLVQVFQVVVFIGVFYVYLNQFVKLFASVFERLLRRARYVELQTVSRVLSGLICKEALL